MIGLLFTSTLCGEAMPIFYSGSNGKGGTSSSAKPWTETIDDEYPLEYIEMFKNATSDKNNIDTETINLLAQFDFVPAIYLKGEMYLYGIPPLDMNFTLAYKEYTRAAEKGFPNAFAALAFMSHYGFGIDKEVDDDLYALYLDLGIKAGSLEAKLMAINNMASYKPSIAIDYSFLEKTLEEIIDSPLKDSPDDEILSPTLEIKSEPEVNPSVELIKYKASKGGKNEQIATAQIFGEGLMGQKVDKNLSSKFLDQTKDTSYYKLNRARDLIDQNAFDEARDLLYDIGVENDPAKNDVLNILGFLEGKSGNRDLMFSYWNLAAQNGGILPLYNQIVNEFEREKYSPDPNFTDIYTKAKLIEKSSYVANHLLFKIYASNSQYRSEALMLNTIPHVIHKLPWSNYGNVAVNWYQNGMYEKALILWLRSASIGNIPSKKAAGLYMLYGDMSYFNKTNEWIYHFVRELIGYVDLEEHFAYTFELVGEDNFSYYLYDFIKNNDTKAIMKARAAMYNGINPTDDYVDYYFDLFNQGLIGKVAGILMLPRLLITELLHPLLFIPHAFNLILRFRFYVYYILLVALLLLIISSTDCLYPALDDQNDVLDITDNDEIFINHQNHNLTEDDENDQQNTDQIKESDEHQNEDYFDLRQEEEEDDQQIDDISANDDGEEDEVNDQREELE